jgi:RNA polymerase sigma factor (sigma-70 family)
VLPDAVVAACFAAHHAPLVRYLARLVGDPDVAADAAQEAFVRLIATPPRVAVPPVAAPAAASTDGPPPPPPSSEALEAAAYRGWLFAVATNLVREGVRTSARRLRLLEARPERAPIGDMPPDAHTQLERAARRAAVRRALDALGEKERTALLLREEGFAHREIAAALGTTTGSIGTLLARALAKLARALPPDAEAL